MLCIFFFSGCRVSESVRTTDERVTKIVSLPSRSEKCTKESESDIGSKVFFSFSPDLPSMLAHFSPPLPPKSRFPFLNNANYGPCIRRLVGYSPKSSAASSSTRSAIISLTLPDLPSSCHVTLTLLPPLVNKVSSHLTRSDT